MRFGISAEVKSHLLLQQPVSYDVGVDRLELTARKYPGILDKVVVSRKVDEFRRLLPSIEPASVGRVPVFHLSAPPFVDDLIALLQYIESHGSLWIGVQKIGWEDPTLTWLPDSAEEEALLEIGSYEYGYRFPDDPEPFAPENLAEMLRRKAAKEYLVVPLSFYREGLNEHHQTRFVNAFINFYLFIEGLYAGGYTSNRRVVRELLASEQLRNAISGAIDRLNEPRLRTAHLAKLETWLSLRRWSLDVQGVVNLLVWMRGNLLHFSTRSSTPKGHPLNQREYESLSFLAFAVSTNVAIELASGRSLG